MQSESSNQSRVYLKIRSYTSKTNLQTSPDNDRILVLDKLLGNEQCKAALVTPV